jgi:hypothetical protein
MQGVDRPRPCHMYSLGRTFFRGGMCGENFVKPNFIGIFYILVMEEDWVIYSQT